jgi:Asp-tRNA(Asn)/Glu-tRNA(Gln) amidotransferase A subunit family amidase
MKRTIILVTGISLDSLYEQKAREQGKEDLLEGIESSAYSHSDKRSNTAGTPSPQTLFHGTADDVGGFDQRARKRTSYGQFIRSTHYLTTGRTKLIGKDTQSKVNNLFKQMTTVITPMSTDNPKAHPEISEEQKALNTQAGERWRFKA